MSEPPQPTFAIRTESAPPGRAIVHVDGEVDLTTVPAVEEAVSSVAGRATEVILDLGDVAFLDSAGVALLIRLDAASRSDGFGLAILAGRPVRRVLVLCGVADRLPIRDP